MARLISQRSAMGCRVSREASPGSRAGPNSGQMVSTSAPARPAAVHDRLPPRNVRVQGIAPLRSPRVGDLRSLRVAHPGVDVDGCGDCPGHLLPLVLQEGLVHAAPVGEIGREPDLGTASRRAMVDRAGEGRPSPVDLVRNGIPKLPLELRRPSANTTRFSAKRKDVAARMGVDQKRRRLRGPAVLLLEAAGVRGAVRARCPLLGHRESPAHPGGTSARGAPAPRRALPVSTPVETRFPRKLQVVIEGLARHSPHGAEPRHFHVKSGPAESRRRSLDAEPQLLVRGGAPPGRRALGPRLHSSSWACEAPWK